MPEMPRADLIRRSDIMQTVSGVIDIYGQQQRAALQGLQDETMGGRSFLSDAGQVAERRKTSSLYLGAYGTVSGLTMGGLAFLAHVAGGVDGILSIGGWMFGTGALTLFLTWVRHGDEFKHSPEGIAHKLIDAHLDVQLYGLESQRMIVELEHESEERRQAAQAQAAQDARQLAELRIKEVDERRKAIDAQNERRFSVQWTEAPETVQDAPQATQTALQVQSIDDDAGTPTGGSTWRDGLIIWVSQLYADPSAMGESGVIKSRVPWAARSPWLDADKAEARRACCELRPKLIEPSEGGRWRLRREMFPSADLALTVLRERL
jgi:hypothetical protein